MASKYESSCSMYWRKSENPEALSTERAMVRVRSTRDIAGQVINRNNWPCILHLYGSVHFDMRSDNHNLHTVFWHKDLDQNFQQNAAGRNLRYTNEGITFPTSSIIAGYGKTAQILTLPFRTYYAEMDRLIFESDAALFMGYGFADNHINEAFSDYRDSRNRKVAIIDYACCNTTTAGSGFDTDHAPISKAMNIITTDIGDMECLGRKIPEPPPINESISRVNPDKLWTTFGRHINGTEALYSGADYRAIAAG